MEILGLPIASATASMSLRSEHRLPSDNRAKTRRPPRTHRLLNSSKALVTQNAVAHIEVLSEEMHAPAKAFWKNRNPATEGPMRSLLTMETTCFHYLHGAGQPERVSRDSWALDQVLFDRPGNAEIEPDLLYDCRNDRPRSTE